MKERSGNLDRTGLPSLLHLIYEKGDAAGELDVTNEPARKRFFFRNGMPVAASSNILSEVLGRLLLSERVISQKDYEASLEVALREGKRHGEVMTAMGIITPVELERFLALQLKRRLLKVFGWTHGEYRYMKVDAVPAAASLKPIHPAPLILEGITLGFYPPARAREDLARHIDAAYGYAGAQGKYRAEDFNMNLQEKRFLESFDGSKPLKDVLDGSDLLRGRANALALSFIITGLVRTATAAAVEQDELVEETSLEAAPAAGGAPRLNAELLFMKAKTALNEKNFKRAMEILKEITDLNPAEGEYWAFLGWAVYNDDPSRIREAEKTIKDAIDLNADLDMAWHFLGKVSLAGGDAALAERCFRTALARNPWALESLCELKRMEMGKSGGRERKNYMEAFGFLEDPFGETPDLGYIELSRARTGALDAAVDAVRKKSGPMLIEGAKGAGKTAFCLELLRRLHGDKTLSAYILQPEKKEINLIKAINGELGCATASASVKEELLSLGMRIAQNRTQGGHTMIIMDEAHRLTPGGVKLVQYLSRLKTLQIILAAEPSFSATLRAPEFEELGHRLASRHFLDALSLEETKAYVLGRLNGARRAGQSAEFSATDEAMKLIFDESNGMPAGINATASILLERAALLGSFVLDVERTEPAEKEEEAAPAVSSYEEQISELEGLTPIPSPEGARPAEPVDEVGEKEEAVAVEGPFVEESRPAPQAVSAGAEAEEAEAKRPSVEVEAPAARPAPERPPATEALPKKRPSGRISKTKALLLVVLIFLAGVLAWTYLIPYFDEPSQAPRPAKAPAAMSRRREMSAPLAGSSAIERVPATVAEKAQEKAASTPARRSGQQ